jgi:hypothetical protein
MLMSIRNASQKCARPNYVLDQVVVDLQISEFDDSSKNHRAVVRRLGSGSSIIFAVIHGTGPAIAGSSTG